MKHRFALFIFKVNVKKPYVAHKLCVGYGAIGLMIMAPSPHVCAVVTFYYFAVNLFCVNKRNVTVVNLGFFVHYGEHSFRSRHTHDDCVNLVGNLVNVSRELLCHVKEGYKYAYPHGKPRNAYVWNARNKQCAAAYRNDNVKHVTDVVKQGT